MVLSCNFWRATQLSRPVHISAPGLNFFINTIQDMKNTLLDQAKIETERAHIHWVFAPGGWFTAKKVSVMGLVVFMGGIVVSAAFLKVSDLHPYGVGVFVGGIFASSLGLGIASWLSTEA